MRKTTLFLLAVLMMAIITICIVVPSNYLISVDLGSFTKWSGDESFGDQPSYAFCFYKEGLYSLVAQNVYDFDNFNLILSPDSWDCPIG